MTVAVQLPAPEIVETSDPMEIIRSITRWLSGRPLDKQLQRELTLAFPPDGPEFKALAATLRYALTHGGIGSRVNETTVYAHLSDPGKDTCGFSIDVVQLTNVKGGKHRHPKGEIDIIIPVDATALFDGRGEGWLVYPPGSTHSPSVRRGSAIVLFMLPDGEMTFE